MRVRGATVPAVDVGARLRAEVPLWEAALARDDATTRPDDATWSTTEYGCHVRDVCRLYAWRLDLMLTEDDPLFPNWSPDDAAVDGDYAGALPEDVRPEVAIELELLAAAFDTVRPDEWGRPGRRSDGAVFTIDSFSRYLLHDVVHHGWDVTGRLRARLTGRLERVGTARTAATAPPRAHCAGLPRVSRTSTGVRSRSCARCGERGSPAPHGGDGRRERSAAA